MRTAVGNGEKRGPNSERKKCVRDRLEVSTWKKEWLLNVWNHVTESLTRMNLGGGGGGWTVNGEKSWGEAAATKGNRGRNQDKQTKKGFVEEEGGGTHQNATRGVRLWRTKGVAWKNSTGLDKNKGIRTKKRSNNKNPRR